jgi:general secretion pathway protein D
MKFPWRISLVTSIGVSLTGLILSLSVFCASQSVSAESASGYYKMARAAEDRNDVIAAYEAYKKAYDLKPGEIKYRTTYERVRAAASTEYVSMGEKFARKDNLTSALAAFLKALDIDPGNELADAGVRKIQNYLRQSSRQNEGSTNPDHVAKNLASPISLDILANEPITLHMAEDSKVIYQAVGKSVGINVLFDPDYNSKRIQVDLKDVTATEALDIISEISASFWKAVTHNTIFVAQDTRAKRQALSQQAVQIFYLKNVSQPNDLTDIQTAIRNMLPTAKLFGVASQNAIIIRGTPDELILAKVLVAGLDQPKPEVLVDITVMEVSRDKVREIGLSPPTSLTVSSGSAQTLNQIGRSSAYSISIGTAAVQFLLTDSDTRILQSPRLRAVDGQKATLKLGEKLPVATGTYTLATSSTSAAAETQFQYLDVGVNVEMTPTIHSDREVTLKLSVEVSSESGTETIDDVEEPIISQEKAEQTIRLKDGETSILAGLVKKSVSQAVSGWPGFGQIPLMKYFFTTQKHEVDDDELVFMIVPHIVRAPGLDTDTERRIDTGTDKAVQIREVPSAEDSSQPNHR